MPGMFALFGVPALTIKGYGQGNRYLRKLDNCWSIFLLLRRPIYPLYVMRNWHKQFHNQIIDSE